MGDEVRFSMGMDEHGQKVSQAAAAEGVDPQALVDRLSGRFRAMWERLGVSNDRWVRTTDAHHRRGVGALIERCLERNPNDFYEKAYEGYYCVGCELFKRDHEIVDGRCILHPTRELQWTEERNWFFRLSAYGEFLRRHFDLHPRFLQPESRRNEILALIDGGLEDISVTRARLSWAIPFPRPTSTGWSRGRGCGSTRSPTTSPTPATPTPAGRRGGRRSCTWWARTSPACTPSSGRRCSSARGCRCPSASGGTAS
jgi:methionyl-tRNA synthetase